MNSHHRLTRLLGLSLALTLLTLGLSACGGSKSRNFAPSSLNNRNFVVVDPDLPGLSTTYTFVGTTSGTYTSPGGDSGSFTYNRGAVIHTATLSLTSDFAAPTFSPLQLTFSSPTTGNYTRSDSKSAAFTLP